MTIHVVISWQAGAAFVALAALWIFLRRKG